MGLFNLFKKEDGIYANLTNGQYNQMKENGELQPIYLIDPRFGGANDLGNILYVPANIVSIKKQIDDELAAYLEQGMSVTGFNCFPTYKGKCNIPSKIMISANVNGNSFIRNIDIW